MGDLEQQNDESGSGKQQSGESGDQDKKKEAQKPEDLQSQLAAAAERERLLKEENQRAKSYLVGLVKRVQELSAGGGGGGDEDDEDAEEKQAERFKKQFEENPLAALDAHFAARMQPMHEENLNRQVRMNKEAEIAEIKAKYGEKKWKQYAAAVEEFMAPISAKAKADKGTWLHAFKLVRADNFDEEVAEKVREATSHEEDAEVEGAGRSGPGGKGRPSFGPLERKAMAEFGMDEKEWIKYGGGSDSQYFHGPSGGED